MTATKYSKSKTLAQGRKVGSGRPCTLTPELTVKMAASVRTGSTPEDAASLELVPLSTFRLWCDQARDGKQPYLDWSLQIRKSQAEFRAEHLANIQAIAKGAKGYWAASAFILDRLFPEMYAQTTRNINQNTVSIEPGAALKDALARVEDIAQSALPTPEPRVIECTVISSVATDQADVK